jgi:hypothetical protein
MVSTSISKKQYSHLLVNEPSNLHLSESQQLHLSQALSLLNSSLSKINVGTGFHGQPIGTPEFSCAFLSNGATKFEAAITRLTSCLSDPQTIAVLFKFCAIPSLAHLLATPPTSSTTLTLPLSLC